jgi:uroporphyrinogen III methyltransferase/synthase
MKEVKEKKTDASASGADCVKPLIGKTVLLTRPREQAAEITLMLESLGAAVIHAPMIEIREPDSWQLLDASIKQIHFYDWLLFTSANGVKYFLRRFNETCNRPLASISSLKICAIGKATAQALESTGVPVDLIAGDSTAEGVLQSLLAHLGKASALGGLRFLLPRARMAREVLPEELRRLGALVDAVETYQNVLPVVDSDNLRRLLRDGAIDAVTFTSSSTVNHFATLFGSQDLSALLQNTLVACIGPITAATAAEHHLKNIIQPDTYNAPALVEAVVQALCKK